MMRRIKIPLMVALPAMIVSLVVLLGYFLDIPLLMIFPVICSCVGL